MKNPFNKRGGGNSGATLSGLTYKGLLTLSAAMNLPAATEGDWYITDGTSNWVGGTGYADGGIYLNAGDVLICITDTTAGPCSTKRQNWFIKQNQISMPDGQRVIEMVSDTIATYVPANGLRFLNNVLYVYQNSIGQPASPVSTAKQSADVTNSTLVMSNVTGVAFTLLANHRYMFKIIGTFQTAVTTTGLALGFTSPAITAMQWMGMIRTGSAGTDQFYTAEWNTYDSVAVISTAVPVENTDYLFTVEGMIEPSAAGTLQLQCRSEVDTSQVTVKDCVATITDAG